MPRQDGGRLVGVDVARALAIVGMVAVHFAPRPNDEDGIAAWILGVPYGKASILFALVAGVGVSLFARGRPSMVRARLVWRTTWLFPAGLALQALDHPVAVILQYYAIWFLLAAAFVEVADRTLLATAMVWLSLGSLAVAWTGINHADWMLPLRGDSPGGVLMDILLTGYYPTATWFPVLLFGMWLGRKDLASDRVRGWLVGAGLVVATVAYRLGPAVEPMPERSRWNVLWAVEGHSEMPLAVIGATALVAALLGLLLWAGERVPQLLRPLAALGEGALTVYVGHIVVWHVTDGAWFSTSTSARTLGTIAGFTVVTAAGMTAWLAVFARGPLETAARWPFEHLFAPLVAMAAGPSTPPPVERSRPPAAAENVGRPGDPGASSERVKGIEPS